MARKKKAAAGPSLPRPNDDWLYETEIQINGRYVTPGTELKISGERGRFRFVNRVTKPDGLQWITVWGGPKGCETLRSFYPERIKRVHYKNATVENLAKEHKLKKAALKAEKAAEAADKEEE